MQSVGAIVEKENKILLVRQYRKNIKKYTWEIPAGTIEFTDKSAKAAMIRELHEETGIYLKDLKFVTKLALAPGSSSEQMSIYKGNIDKLPSTKAEFITGEVAKQEFINLVTRGEIIDSKTITCGLMYFFNAMPTNLEEQHE